MENIAIHCISDELINPKKLKNHPKNRNKHPKEQIERLANLYKYHGVRHPIIVSKRSTYIVAGHGRKEAAIKAGIALYPVVFQDFDSDEAEYAFIQADNAIALWSELDFSGINSDIGDLGPDFDLDMLGIKGFEIDVADKLEPGCDEDEAPETRPDTTTKIGDLYILGDHRLLCGDSTNIQHVDKLMDGQKADMVFTDPPYNTGMSAKTNGGSTRLNHMFDDDYTDDEWDEFLSCFIASYWAFSKDTSIHYVCLNWKRSHELVPKYKQAGFNFSNLIVWDKVVHGLGSDYKYTHEFIHVFKKGKPKLDTHQGDDREYSDVWHIQRKMGKDEDHATKKPIELVERAINHSTNKSSLILDLFGGSGSTLIACEKTRRKCFMMELDPYYCDVIVSRWEKYSGKKAELIHG